MFLSSNDDMQTNKEKKRKYCCLFEVSQVEYDEEIEKEKERLRLQFERETSELRRQCQAERLTKEELQKKYDVLQEQYQTGVNGLTANSRSKKNKNSMKNIGDTDEKFQRLQELEKTLIGGEEINNEERKKKRKKKLNDMREKQEQRSRFSRLVNSNENEDMMMKVFDNVQEEVS